MPYIRRILVAIKDTGSRKQSPAVIKAAQLASGLGARLELFHAIDSPVYIDSRRPTSARVKLMRQRVEARYVRHLERIADRIRQRGLKVTTAVDWDFPSYEAVVRHARRTHAELIIVERHGGGRHFAPWLLHMADWELLRLSPVPVLIVKNPRPYDRPTILAAVDPTHVFAKPARLDDDILGTGKIVSKALRGALHVMHAYVPMPADMPGATVDISENVTADIERKALARARTVFESCLRSTAIPAARQHLVEDRPMLAIPEVARRTRSSIVVMGAISRSGLKAAFIGNTAERVLDDLTCDLLVVKPQRFVNRVQRARRGMRIAAMMVY
jgi:universal stress protein E